ALMMYTQDYDETFPKSEFVNQNDWGSWPQNHYIWSSTRGVQPYIKNLGVFRCPSDPAGVDPGIGQATGPNRVPGVLSYMVNSFNRDPSGSSTAFGVPGPQGAMTIGPTYGGTDAPTTLAAMPAPADLILLCEGQWDVNNWWCGSG